MLHSSSSFPGATRSLSRILAASSFAAALFLGFPGQSQAQKEPEPIGARLTRSVPFRFVGRLAFNSDGDRYIGTGSVVTFYGVLTAAHNLYDPRGGYSTKITWERAKYGRSVLSRAFPAHIYVLSGYTSYAGSNGPDSTLAFSRDIGGLRFSGSPGGGSRLAYTTTNTAIRGRGTKIPVGYGAEWHSGNEMVACVSNSTSRHIRDGYFSNRGFIVEAGQSGGPVLIQNRVAAVLVSGSNFDAGVRAVDATVATFIRSFL